MPEANYNVLCPVCKPWNNEKELLRSSMPAWQNYLQEQQHNLMREAEEWLKGEHRIIGAFPYDHGWAELLRRITGNNNIACSSNELESHRDYHVYLQIRKILAGRNSDLFPNLVGSKYNGEFEGRFNGYKIKTSKSGLIIDGVRVEKGPGSLLFMMMLESRIESVVLRFLTILRQIEGHTRISNSVNIEEQRNVLRNGMFSLFGSSDAPQPEGKRKKTAPPPLCDWDHKTYLLGIETGVGERHVIQLPTQPHLLERFLTIWSGRPTMQVSDRLRALTICLTKLVGYQAEDARITPLERSFSLLRSVVDNNSDKVVKNNNALFIKGGSGIIWRVKPGRGAHNSPYLIQTLSKNNLTLGRPICMYDDADLPLGDRLSSVILSLINDDKLRHKFEQINYAIIRQKSIDEQHLIRNNRP